MAIINLKSPRYVRAKVARHFTNKIFNTIAVLLVILASFYGLAIFIQGSNLGWILLVPLALLFMAHEWYMYGLKNVQPVQESDKPEDFLSQDILANITSENPILNEIITCIAKNSGRIFFHNRFLVSDDLLELADIDDISLLLSKAHQFNKEFAVDSGVDGSHITVAILLGAKNKEDLLRTIKYSEEEILKGLAWYAYLANAINSMKQKQSSGGIARDWATGYTPLLSRYAQNISYSIQYGGTTHRDIFSRKKVVDQMISIFSSAGRANVALVGETGSGKHICVLGLADELIFGEVPGSLKYTQIYQIDIATLMSTIKLSSLEHVLNEIMVESFHAKNVILFFNNAGQLFGSDDLVDLSNFLQPIIEAGNLRTIFSFTNVQWQYIQRNKPAISAIFNYQAVLPTDENETISILENEAIFIEHKYKCLFTYESLKEIYRLAVRYGPDIAMPSKAISVMESAGRAGDGGIVTSATVQQAIESSTGVKVGLAVGSEKDKLLNLETEIHRRVIGQDLAVKEVVSALKRNRSGVSSSSRPIGTFLFLGPTGVGKTELSKALAEAYFGEESRLVRLDMNEFINQDSVSRLLTTGNQTSPSFLDKIKQQPFSVVLLDEIEKAHPDIVNMFLQVLDEGVLVDTENRQISFKDTIIIATTNAGADFIREQIANGTEVSKTTDILVEKLINDGKFKPEFINRFDDTIVFKPLEIAELNNVVKVLLSQINNELANQKITVNLDENAISWLANTGHDPAMGARPLRRLMQKTIETIVADKILEQTIQPGDTLLVTGQDLVSYSS